MEYFLQAHLSIPSHRIIFALFKFLVDVPCRFTAWKISTIQCFYAISLLRDSDDPDVQVVAAPLPAPRTSRPASTSATTRLPMTTATHQPLATASTTTRLATTSTTSSLTLASTTPPLTMTTTQQQLATVSTSSQSIDLTTFQIPETEEESMEAALTEAVR